MLSLTPPESAKVKLSHHEKTQETKAKKDKKQKPTNTPADAPNSTAANPIHNACVAI